MDNTFKVSVTRSVADANDTLVLADGNLSVVTEDNAYELQDNSLIASSTLLNGTLTATSWVYNSEPEKIVEFKYNSAGLRVQKDVTVNGEMITTKYIFHGRLLTELNIGENNLHFSYDMRSRPACVNFNGESYMYVYNLQGDILGLVDRYNNYVVKYAQDAWGKLLNTDGAMATTLGKYNPFIYRGYMFDHDLCLHDLQRRFYNPERIRFISSDRIVAMRFTHNNLYSYCWNNPIVRKDKSGTDWETIEDVYNWTMICLEDFGEWFAAETTPEALAAKYERAKNWGLQLCKDIEEEYNRFITDPEGYLSETWEDVHSFGRWAWDGICQGFDAMNKHVEQKLHLITDSIADYFSSPHNIARTLQYMSMIISLAPVFLEGSKHAMTIKITNVIAIGLCFIATIIDDVYEEN